MNTLFNARLRIATVIGSFFATMLCASAWAADVGVSVRISQPGVYGRIDIGRFPQPQVWVPQPIVVSQPVYLVQQPPPAYMWVPPGHRKHWAKHCYRYRACGHPVYFVRDDWYGQHVHRLPSGYSPQREWRGQRYGLRQDGVRDAMHADSDFHGHPGHGRGPGNGPGNGPGHGHGKGHDKHGH
jgi:hypothetical protein